MQTLLTFLVSGSTRRFVAFLIGAAALLLNKKWGMDISEAAQMELTALVMGFIAQSAGREAHKEAVASRSPRPELDGEAPAPGEVLAGRAAPAPLLAPDDAAKKLAEIK